MDVESKKRELTEGEQYLQNIFLKCSLQKNGELKNWNVVEKKKVEEGEKQESGSY